MQQDKGDAGGTTEWLCNCGGEATVMFIIIKLNANMVKALLNATYVRFRWFKVHFSLSG